MYLTYTDVYQILMNYDLSVYVLISFFLFSFFFKVWNLSEIMNLFFYKKILKYTNRYTGNC